MKLNTVTLQDIVIVEPSYGYIRAGMRYCKFAILWIQEMTAGPKEHEIPAVAAGDLAERAAAELAPGMEIEARGRLSASGGHLRFLVTSYTLAGTGAKPPAPDYETP